MPSLRFVQWVQGETAWYAQVEVDGVRRELKYHEQLTEAQVLADVAAQVEVEIDQAALDSLLGEKV